MSVKNLAIIGVVIINIAIFLLGVGTLIYFLWFIPFQNTTLQKGYDIAVNQVIDSVQKSGKVIVSNITLIPLVIPTPTPIKK